MAGTSYFNTGSAGNGTGSPYPKLIATPNPYITNKFGGNGSFVTTETSLFYAYRAPVGNRGLRILSATSVSLLEVQSNGSTTTVSNFDPTSYLPNGVINPQQICYSTVDQCWYILITYVNPTHCRLIKVADTTGAVTAIGSAFNPANPSISWPSMAQGHILTSFYLDNVSGHLKLICNGFYHLINKATGAIVSQDTPLTLATGSYSLLGCSYITQSNRVAVGYVNSFLATGDNSVRFIRLYGSSGLIGALTIPHSHLSFSTDKISKVNYIDHDKFYVGDGSQIVTVAEYDKFLEAFYDYNVS